MVTVHILKLSLGSKVSHWSRGVISNTGCDINGHCQSIITVEYIYIHGKCQLFQYSWLLQLVVTVGAGD